MYIVLEESKIKLPDGDYLRFQRVLDTSDKEGRSISYRFIRSHSDGRLKAHRGQAQVNDYSLFTELIKLFESRS